MNRFIQKYQAVFLLLMVRNPFIVAVDDLWVTQAKKNYAYLSVPNLQNQLIDLQSDDELKILHSCKSSADFWLSVPQICCELKSLSLEIVRMFGSTYICESSFSNMNFIKNKYRTRLSHMHMQDILRICTTTYVPDFSKIARSSKCHFSY